MMLRQRCLILTGFCLILDTKLAIELGVEAVLGREPFARLRLVLVCLLLDYKGAGMVSLKTIAARRGWTAVAGHCGFRIWRGLRCTICFHYRFWQWAGFWHWRGRKLGGVVGWLREPDANVWLTSWRSWSLIQVGVLILDHQDPGPVRKITIIELKGDFEITSNISWNHLH